MPVGRKAIWPARISLRFDDDDGRFDDDWFDDDWFDDWESSALGLVMRKRLSPGMRNVQHNATAAAWEGRGKNSRLVRVQNGSGHEAEAPPVVSYNYKLQFRNAGEVAERLKAAVC
jgi:hypothetical protein